MASSTPADVPPAQPLTLTQWLIVGVASLGFAFDTFVLLMMPIIAKPALAELLKQPDEAIAVGNWIKYIFWSSALAGGFFGLIGGYLTDFLGRRRILTYSILLYAFSALASGFSTSPMMLLVLRCTTFVGVCVEFVAAVAWLAELFPNPRQREKVLGYTQAFSSVGGLLVTASYFVCNHYAEDLPAIFSSHTAWRYTLISGVLPAIPLIVIRPFLPESPVWKRKAAEGTLRRPSILALFQPMYLRTTLVTALLFACAFGAAFGAIQVAPQIVPSLLGMTPETLKEKKQEYQELVKADANSPRSLELKNQIDLAETARDLAAKRAQYRQAEPDSPKAQELLAQIQHLRKPIEEKVSGVQFWQEMGGLAGRTLMAVLALWIVSRRNLLWIFQIPGLIIVPLVFFFPGRNQMGDNNLLWMQIGMALAGFFTVAQFSFWGNYLPLVYPPHLRGTGEGFAANVGGRMLGTSMNFVTLTLAPFMIGPDLGPGRVHPSKIAVAAGCVALGVYLFGSILTFFLPEPKPGGATE